MLANKGKLHNLCFIPSLSNPYQISLLLSILLPPQYVAGHGSSLLLLSTVRYGGRSGSTLGYALSCGADCVADGFWSQPGGESGPD